MSMDGFRMNASSSLFSTTENLCIYVWDQMTRELKDNRKLLYEVCIHETENNIFFYRGE